MTNAISVWRLALPWLVVFSGAYVAMQANAVPVESDEPKSAEFVAKQILGTPVLRDWKLQHVDQEPTVHVNGFSGFRIVIRRTWPVYNAPPTQQASIEIPTGFVNDDWEFVLIPLKPRKAPVDLKSKIKWVDSKCPYHTADICMGEGHGYQWFTRAMIVYQHGVRKELKLTGGDDPIAVLASGLLVDDKGTSTRGSVQFALREYGDQALPYIESVVKKAGDDPWWPITSLKSIQTDRATELLLKYFRSGNDKVRHPAMYSLIHEPFRETAKDAYFEILRERRYLPEIQKASLQFGWQDALPLFREIAEQPKTLRQYAYAVYGRRALEGKPIPQEMMDAERTMAGVLNRAPTAKLKQKIAAARQLLIESDDSEAANLAALMLAIFSTKGNGDPVQKVGVEILKSRPRGSTSDFLQSLADRISHADRAKVEEILTLVQADVNAKINGDAEDAIAWGEPVNGLKAGLSYQTFPFVEFTDRVPLGERLSLDLVVKNVSDKTVDLHTVTPAYSAPKVTDNAGEKKFAVLPAFSGPPIFQTHKLDPNQTIRMPMQACTVSPRVPIYNLHGYHVHAGMGKYRITTSIDVTPMVDSVKPTLLHTGAIECEIIKPNKETITRRFVAELKKRVEDFNCKVVYLGPGEPPLRSAGLVNPKFKLEYPDYWSIVKIDRQAANKIIDFMADEGLFFRYVTDTNIPSEYPQTTYFLSIAVGKGRLGLIMIPLPWSSMKPQLEKLRDAVGGKGAVALQKILDQPLFADWHQIASGLYVGLSMQRQLYLREDDTQFYVRFRLTNRTNSDVFVDLSRKNVFYPNQWGFHRQNHRVIIDEERIIPEQLSAEQKQRVVADAKAGKLTKIPAAQSIDYFREFNRGGHADVIAQQHLGKFMIISADGQLRTSDGTTAENFHLNRDGDATDTVDTDVVIAKPIDFQPIPKDALVVE